MHPQEFFTGKIETEIVMIAVLWKTDVGPDRLSSMLRSGDEVCEELALAGFPEVDVVSAFYECKCANGGCANISVTLRTPSKLVAEDVKDHFSDYLRKNAL